MPFAFSSACVTGVRPLRVPIHARNPTPTRMTRPATSRPEMKNRRTGGWHSTEVPSAEAPMRTMVDLPPSVGEQFEVYVNGVPQRRGEDYRVDGGTLVFTRALATEGKLGPIRWLSMFLGIAGTYRQHDTVDVIYEHGGRRTVASGLPYRTETGTA